MFYLLHIIVLLALFEPESGFSSSSKFQGVVLINDLSFMADLFCCLQNRFNLCGAPPCRAPTHLMFIQVPVQQVFLHTVNATFVD